MRRHLLICAALAAVALPGLAQASDETPGAPLPTDDRPALERRPVEPSPPAIRPVPRESANPDDQEQSALPREAPAVGGKTSEDIIQSAPQPADTPPRGEDKAPRGDNSYRGDS